MEELETSAGRSDDSLNAFLEFCDQAIARIDGSTERHADVLKEALRFERTAVLSRHQLDNQDVPMFSSGDALAEQPLTMTIAQSIRPLRGNTLLVATFAFDITKLFELGVVADSNSYRQAMEAAFTALPSEPATF
jgi:hypothetical protein